MTVRLFILGMALLLGATVAAAEPILEDLFDYLPASGEVSGWEPDGAPKTYHGDELFMMINGGADIYHEYGFDQVVRETYMDAEGRSVNLEIYRMKSPAAAYGIYSFKAGEGGAPMAIGQEARLQDYYLNFWKNDLLVTVIGLDSDPQTVQGVAALAKAVDGRIAGTGKTPDLADRLLGATPGFADAKYVRGPLGVMGSYVFDTENIFRVREGMIGRIGNCKVFAFRYDDSREGTAVLEKAVEAFETGSRFTVQSLQGDRYTMVDRDKAVVMIGRIGRYIAVVIGQNRDEVNDVLDRLIAKLTVS